MDNNPHLQFLLYDRSYASIVKKEIKKLAEHIGFIGNRLAEIEIIIAEITSNIIKHSSGGYILVKHFYKGSIEGLEMISIDKGPGMANAMMMVKDGVSTTNTLGQGLGAIKRLSDNFDIYSVLGSGTILLSRIFINPENEALAKDTFNVHTLMLAKKGEVFCGDGYKYLLKKQSFEAFVIDGLGHGPEAHNASEAAINSFLQTQNQDLSERLKIMNSTLKRTRGGVGIILNIDLKEMTISYCGVGNISARIISEGKLKSCISYNGIIGHTFPNTIHNNTIPWNKSDYLIITTDGINTRWDVNALSSVLKHDPSIIAASLFKDFSRGNDDTLVMIVKCNRKIV